MNNISRIFILIAAALPFALPCSGQKPEPLTFTKTYRIPGAEADSIRGIIHQWDPSDCGLRHEGFTYRADRENGHLEYDRVEDYRGRFSGLDFGNTKGTISPCVDIRISDGYFDLKMHFITVSWKHKIEMELSTRDDRLNRNWLWRIHHDRKVLDQARLRSAEIFERITATMDRFLAEGPPMELRAME